MVCDDVEITSGFFFLRGFYFFSLPIVVFLVTRGAWGLVRAGEWTQKAAVLECALANTHTLENYGPWPWLEKNKIDAICRPCSF